MTTATGGGTETADASGDGDDTRICYRCGVSLPADATRCSNCGRKQMRTCYCGNSIPVTALECPYCGADWSSTRRSKRRSRSRSIKPAVLARYAGIGALASLVVLFVANILISYLAGYAADPAAPAAAYPERLMFAYEGMIRISASIRQMLGSHSGSLVVVGMGLGLGAIIGAVLYMVRVGAIKIGKRRRSRRKRSSQRSDSNRTLS